MPEALRHEDRPMNLSLSPVGSLVIASAFLIAASGGSAQQPASEASYQIVDRGGSYRVWQKTTAVTNNLTGQVSQKIQSITELGDGMHHLKNGQWAESIDLVEATPDGTAAVALHGQMTARIDADITSAGAISLTSPAGEVFASHPLGLFYADSTGTVARVASVQSCNGVIYPPNMVVFSNILSGLDADLMLVWATNGYEQNLILKQA